jgi:hypothetical protein
MVPYTGMVLVVRSGPVWLDFKGTPKEFIQIRYYGKKGIKDDF